jgi:hypothetical protein
MRRTRPETIRMNTAKKFFFMGASVSFLGIAFERKL